MNIYLDTNDSYLPENKNINRQDNNNLLINNTEYKVDYYIENCMIFENKYLKVNILNNNSEYKVNINLDNIKYTKIYGWIQDFNGNNISNIKVLVYKRGFQSCFERYLPIFLGFTDSEGMFQILLKNHNQISNLKIEIKY